MKNEIAKYRKQVQFTQEQLGDAAGWSQSRIGNYETGAREPDLDDCWKIVNLFKELGLNLSFEDVFPSPEKRNQSAA